MNILYNLLNKVIWFVKVINRILNMFSFFLKHLSILCGNNKVLELGEVFVTIQSSYLLEREAGKCSDGIIGNEWRFFDPGGWWEIRPSCLWDVKIVCDDIIIFGDSFFFLFQICLFNYISDNIPTLSIPEMFNIKSANPLIFRNSWR